ncbi:MAG TPA: DUF4160 domain-containing protein [Bryobacteraceae bacterium]|nr:DUF4160 domain-containing protein [Bryobacteraceae bacterium]
MPTVLRLDGFRFFFVSNERNEPAHVHVTKADGIAKFWLDPVGLVSSDGFSPPTLHNVQPMVREKSKVLSGGPE